MPPEYMPRRRIARSSTTTLPETDVESRSRLALNPHYHVIFHNDDVTTMDFVVAVLMQVFQHPLPEATRLMLEVHHKGSAVVATLPLEVAEHRRDQVHALARPRGFPLICTIEPA